MDRKSVAILIFSILGMVIWYKEHQPDVSPKPTPQTVTENQKLPSVNPTLMETAGSPGEQESNTLSLLRLAWKPLHGSWIWNMRVLEIKL